MEAEEQRSGVEIRSARRWQKTTHRPTQRILNAVKTRVCPRDPWHGVRRPLGLVPTWLKLARHHFGIFLPPMPSMAVVFLQRVKASRRKLKVVLRRARLGNCSIFRTYLIWHSLMVEQNYQLAQDRDRVKW